MTATRVKDRSGAPPDFLPDSPGETSGESSGGPAPAGAGAGNRIAFQNVSVA